LHSYSSRSFPGFAGSREEVERIEAYYAEHDRSATAGLDEHRGFDASLFNTRSLFRTP